MTAAVLQRSSLGCARCGDCCDPVHLAPDQRNIVDSWRTYLAGNPGDAPRPGSDAAFILDHWHELEHRDTGSTYRCDRFDPDTRQCTAHDDRPRVCSQFPVYDGPVDPEVCPPRCSYLLDVAPADRPDGARPLIPLEVLR